VRFRMAASAIIPGEKMKNLSVAASHVRYI
jgi:hypothetical protein